MPKAASAPKGRAKAPTDPRERKMRQMSRALGIDIAQVAKMLEEQEAGGSAATPASGAGKGPSAAAEEIRRELAGGGGGSANSEQAQDAAAPAAAAAEPLKPEAAGTPGVVICCGGTDWDMVGKSKATGNGNLYTPHLMTFKTRIVAVYSGSTACHSVAVDAAGVAYVWGRNDLGQCGVGTKKTVVTPTRMAQLRSPVVAVSCGRAHTAVVVADGDLYTCGCGSSGQLGTGRIVPDKSPVCSPATVALPNNDKALSAACGGDFTVVLSTEGRLYSFGHPEYGQLGNNTTGEYFVSGNKVAFDHVTSPFHIQHFVARDAKHKELESYPDVRFRAVACGRNHTLALERAPGKRLFSWGFGGYGRLGHNCTDNELVPRLVDSFTRMQHVTLKSLAAGGAASLATTEMGHLYFWGKLPNAPRGEATMYPKMVEDLSNWSVRCMTAGSQCIMVGAETSAVGWGAAICGELGYGEGENVPKTSRVPKMLDALEGLTVKDVAMGVAHSLLLVDDSTEDDKKIIKKLSKFP